MREHARRLGKHVLIYGLSSVLAQSVSFFTLPILSRSFGPREYGVLELLSVTISLASLVVAMGLDVAAPRHFFEYGEVSDRRRLLSTALLTATMSATVAAALMIFSARLVASSLLSDHRYAVVVAIAAATIPMGVVATMTRDIFRLEERPWMYLSSSVLSALVGGAAAVVFATSLSLGVRGVYVGLLCGYGIAAAFNLLGTRHLLGPQYSSRELRAMLAFGLPYLPGSLSQWAVALADRFVLARYVTLGEVGYYAVANRVSSILMLVYMALSMAWGPFALRLHADDPSAERDLEARFFTYIVATMSSLTIAVSAYGPELIKFIAGSAYSPGADVIPLLALGHLLSSTLPITMTALAIVKRPLAISIHVVISAGVNIGLCFVLIPLFGIVGAAWATVIALAVLAAMMYRSAQRRRRAPYQLGRMLVCLALAVPYLGLGYVQSRGVLFAFAIKAPLVVSYPILLLMFRIVMPSEVRRSIDSLLYRLRSRLLSRDVPTEPPSVISPPPGHP